MALDINSPMDLVYECFVKLGLRYVCVTKEGRFAGLVSDSPKMAVSTH
jgi:chloride channel 3/4/5